jgi:DNA-directed RNA polymerase specialized sigma24 family protein
VIQNAISVNVLPSTNAASLLFQTLTRKNPGSSEVAAATLLLPGEVLDALAGLPRPYREAVAAVDVAGLSYAEAARALGVRQGTIMSRVYRGREQVAQVVGAD